MVAGWLTLRRGRGLGDFIDAVMTGDPAAIAVLSVAGLIVVAAIAYKVKKARS